MVQKSDINTENNINVRNVSTSSISISHKHHNDSMGALSNISTSPLATQTNLLPSHLARYLIVSESGLDEQKNLSTIDDTPSQLMSNINISDHLSTNSSPVIKESSTIEGTQI